MNKITVNSIGVNGQKYHYVQNGETLCGAERHRRGTQRSTRRINQEHPGSVATCARCKSIYAARVEPIKQAKAPDASPEAILRAIRLTLTGEIVGETDRMFVLMQPKPPLITVEEAFEVATEHLAAVNPRIELVDMAQGTTTTENGSRVHIWVRFHIRPIHVAEPEPTPTPPQRYSLWKSASETDPWTVWLPGLSKENAEISRAAYCRAHKEVRWDVAPTFPGDVQVKLTAEPSSYTEWPPIMTGPAPERRKLTSANILLTKIGEIDEVLTALSHLFHQHGLSSAFQSLYGQHQISDWISALEGEALSLMDGGDERIEWGAHVRIVAGQFCMDGNTGTVVDFAGHGFRVKLDFSSMTVVVGRDEVRLIEPDGPWSSANVD